MGELWKKCKGMLSKALWETNGLSMGDLWNVNGEMEEIPCQDVSECQHMMSWRGMTHSSNSYNPGTMKK